MADVNANIDVNINTSSALAQLKSLQREIARFHTSVAKSSDEAAIAQRNLQKNFINGVNSIQGFSAELRTVKTTAESFTDALQKNKLSMREYFRYSAASTKSFGRFFRTELDTINKTALENVKRLQTQYIKMGRDANGAMRAIAITPTRLDLKDLTTQTQIAAQKQAIFNQLVKQGSTNLLNFGKNTQWAGRQLMVGFTLPLIGLGSAASKTFMDMETAAIKFRKVYGDLFTPTEEREQALADIQELGREFTKYGIAIAETTSLAADAAAAGFQGIDLQRQVTAATRLQVLGQIEQQKALETTISLQNAFRLSSADLADSINFLNAVENQTVVSLDDITTAIPKAAPIVRELGGDVKDLAFFMAAMKEGGINASEGANALKSGLASLINPSDKARDMLNGFGIDIDNIVNKNAGNVKQTIVEFAMELDKLSSLSRQRAIEQLFGKFQQARLSALFDNVIRDGNQAARVLDLAGTSVEELASLAEQELGVTANSSMFKFRKAVEQLKASLAPVGKIFLEIVTPFLENIGKILDKFNNLSEGSKKVIASLVIGIGAIAPIVLMTFGLLANFVANGIKGIMLLRNGYLRLTGQSQILSEQTNFLTVEQQQALAAAASLEQSHMKLQQVFTGEAAAVRLLINEYQRMIAAQNMAATRFPAMMVPGFRPKGYNKGGEVFAVPGTGNEDTVPAMLTPGEIVVPKEQSQKYLPLLQGIIADNIPGYNRSNVDPNSPFSFERNRSLIDPRFIPTRRGRSATGGERRQVQIPGSFELGHFAAPVQKTAQELRALVANESQKVKDKVEALILSVGDNVGHLFDVFTNEVTVQSSALNQALGELGSGKRAPAQMFLTEAGIDPNISSADQRARVAAYNAPLISKMKDAGASNEEIELAITDLQRAYQEGYSQLGDVTEVTAESVNEVTRVAYERASTTNEKIQQARQSLAQEGAIKGESGLERIRLAGAYNSPAERKKVDTVLEEFSPGMFPTGGQEMVFKGPEARQVGVQNAYALGELYNQLSEEAKKRVAALKGDLIAQGELIIAEAQRIGVNVGEYTIRGIAEGISAASPSQEAKQQGQNVVDGYEQGILEGMDDVSLAASQVKEAATDGLVGGNIPGYGPLKFGPPIEMGGISNGNIPGYGPLKFGEPIDWQQQTIPFEENVAPSADKVTESLDNLSKTTSGSGQKLAKFNDRMMAGSFALSGITGVMSLFGKDMGGVTDVVFKVSSVMFALQSVVQALTSAKLLELAATRASTIATKMGSTGGVAGLFTRGGGFATFGKNLLTAGKLVARFAGPVGAAIGAVTLAVGVFKFFKDRAEENARKINGLGDAAQLTAEKLTALEKIFGADLAQAGAERFKFENAKAAPALTATRRSRAEEVRASKDFQDTFKKDIKSLSEATPEQAKLVLETIAQNLQSRGATKEQIQAFTDALRIEAGQTKIKLDFAALDIGTKEGKNKLKKNVDVVLKDYKDALKKGFGDETKKQSNKAGQVIASTFKTLQLNLDSGKITADEYAVSVRNINDQILAMPKGAARIALIQAVFKGLGKEAQRAAEGVGNLQNKLLVAQAVSLNLVDDKTLAELRNPKTRKAAVEKIRKAYQEYLNAITEGLQEESKVVNEGNNVSGESVTIQDRLIKIYEKQQAKLEKRLETLQKTNDEIDRQNQLVQSQMDLQNQITEAKISGNYLEAASLMQQKMSELADYNRETKEIDIQNQIDKINNRISQLENGAKITSAEKRLLKLEKRQGSTRSGGGTGKGGGTGGGGASGAGGGTSGGGTTFIDPTGRTGGNKKEQKPILPVGTPPITPISPQGATVGVAPQKKQKKEFLDVSSEEAVEEYLGYSKEVAESTNPFSFNKPKTLRDGILTELIAKAKLVKGDKIFGPYGIDYVVEIGEDALFKTPKARKIANNVDLPQFKVGIDNVPYDMAAIIHKGERVLTAEENKRYGQNTSTINATFNIAGGNSDEIVNKVMVKLNTLANKNNKSNRVNI